MIQFPNPDMTAPNPPSTPPTPPSTPHPPPLSERQQQEESQRSKRSNWEDKYRYRQPTTYINNLPPQQEHDDDGQQRYQISTTVTMDEDDEDNLSLDESIQSERSWMSGVSRGTSTYGGMAQNYKTMKENMKLRAQLWDAYRLARIILGKTIGTTFTLESSTILNAIRHVAEMKLELLSLRKEVQFLERLENRHDLEEQQRRQQQLQEQLQQSQETTATTTTTSSPSVSQQTFDASQCSSKQAQLAIQVANLKRQLLDQQSKYQELSYRHTNYVTETKDKLDGILERLEQLPKPIKHDKQANEILLCLQQLMEQVAEANLKTKIDQLQTQHDVARNNALQAQEELERIKHDSTLEQQKDLEMTQLRYQLQLEQNMGHLEAYKEQVKKQQQQILYYRKKCEKLEKGGLYSLANNNSSSKLSPGKRSAPTTITESAVGIAAATTTPQALQDIISRLQQQEIQLASESESPGTSATITSSTVIPEEEVPPHTTETSPEESGLPEKQQQKEKDFVMRQHVIKLLQKMLASHKREEEVKELKLQLQTIKGKEAESEEELHHLKLQLEILQTETKLTPLELERQIKADRTLYKQRLKACVAQEESRIQQMEQLERQCQILTMTAIEIEDLKQDLQNNRNVQELQLTTVHTVGNATTSKMENVQEELLTIRSNQKATLDVLANALYQAATMAKTIPNQEFKTALKELQQFINATESVKDDSTIGSTFSGEDSKKTDEDGALSLVKQLEREIQKVADLKKRLALKPTKEESKTSPQDDSEGDDTAGILC